MPKKKPEPGKLREDVNETAFRVVQAATGEAEKPVPLEDCAETTSVADDQIGNEEKARPAKPSRPKRPSESDDQ